MTIEAFLKAIEDQRFTMSSRNGSLVIKPIARDKHIMSWAEVADRIRLGVNRGILEQIRQACEDRLAVA
jgi:hypothetical protein